MPLQSMSVQSRSSPSRTKAAPNAIGIWKWFAERDQPPRRAFGFASSAEADRPGGIDQTVVLDNPFGALVKFARKNAGNGHRERRILIVAPLSGHFAFLLRDMVAAFAPDASVYVTDWVNARYAPPEAGDFGFSDNVAYVVEAMREAGPSAHVIAVCQGVIPALAATAILSDEHPELAPASLTLMAGPVDPLANPTRVVRLLRDHPLEWYRDHVLRPAPEDSPGAGRLIYPASIQLKGLAAYFTRHMTWRQELYEKTMHDDGDDSAHFPFLDLYASVMDLPAAYFLENTELVFHERAALTGRLRCKGEAVEFGAIRRTALMTVEGERDDIAAPGQTAAAHCLCPRIPEEARRHLVVPGAGHFSLFHGRRWRNEVMPEIVAFMDASDSASCKYTSHN